MESKPSKTKKLTKSRKVATKVKLETEEGVPDIPPTKRRKKNKATAVKVEVEEHLTVTATSDVVEPAEGSTRKARKAPPAQSPAEKRGSRFRKKCPIAIGERAERVMSQRMFMINRDKLDTGEGDPIELFSVLGSTGNVYTVTIGPVLKCDCPDCNDGLKNVPCKHIIFIFLKVLKVPLDSPTWYQKALLGSELRAVFKDDPAAVGSGVAVSKSVRKAYLQAAGYEDDGGEEEPAEEEPAADNSKRLSSIGDDCPVCFEEMTAEDHADDKLVFDESIKGCGKPLHAECFAQWQLAAKKNGGDVTCVWCRNIWVVPASNAGGDPTAGVVTTAKGYLNLAASVGISRQRDTSSYYYGPRRGEKMWMAKYRYRDGD